MKYQGIECEGNYLESGPYDTDSDQQECKDKCLTRDDCGGLLLDTYWKICRLMDRSCTKNNSKSAGNRVTYERLNMATDSEHASFVLLLLISETIWFAAVYSFQ